MAEQSKEAVTEKVKKTVTSLPSPMLIVNQATAKGKRKVVTQATEDQRINEDIKLVRRLLRQNQVSALRIHPKVATQRLTKGVVPKRNPP